jgi:energy-coupling factor transporter ATP-binding protein EcfA2
VSGSVASLLELGVGFHEDLTGMENIFYNGAMMGMRRDEILERLPRIITFSGLADFIYEPVKHYSSGMYSRLACSVALHMDPKIILVDEILAVGDAEFQQRGILRILELHSQGITTLLVTHETATARDLCSRLIWIDQGRLVDDGEPRRIHNEYMRATLTRTLVDSPFNRPLKEEESAGARIARARFLVDGQESDAIETEQPARLEVSVAGNGEVCLGVLWRWTDGRVLTEEFTEPFTLDGEERELVYDIPRWPLIRSRVTASLAVLSPDRQSVHHRIEDAVIVHVETKGFPSLDVLEKPRVSWSVEKL